MVDQRNSAAFISDLQIRHHLWRRGELSFKLDPLQASINDTVLAAYPRAKKVCVLSSRQIGKSYWVLSFATSFLLKNPGSIVRIVAPTKAKAYELVEDNFVPLLHDCPNGLIEKHKSQLRWNFTNGSSLRLGPLERAHVDSNRSGNAKLIIYEECGFVSGDDFNYARKGVLGAQLLRSGGHEIFVTSPSEDPNHPLHNFIMPECDALGTLFRYTVYDSPSITPGQIQEAAERCGGYDSDDFKREYMAQIIRSKTLMVIPTVNERECFLDFEVPRQFEPRLQFVADWGGVRDKTVCYIHFYVPNTDMSYFVDELVYEPNTTTDRIAKDLRVWIKKYNLTHLWADLPGQLQVDLNSMFGLEVSTPPKNDWVAAVNTMAAKFALNKVRVHKRCTFLRASILGGMFNKQRTDFERTSELGHMDGCAALMYAFRTQALGNNSSQYDREHIVDDRVKEAMELKTFGKFRTA
jgi:hypothetical protein